MERPDFLIVGAPKCGTTAMADWLGQHRRVFMPAHKEPFYFGDDLTHRHGRMSRADYRAMFRETRPDQLAGEASTWSLWSSSAADEIRRELPQARIIIMLRNPVDMMASLHAEMVWEAEEDVADFETAVDLDERRGQGIGLPAGIGRPETVRYRSAADFAPQVERYLARFSPDRVHVVLFDDLRADATAVYRAATAFLGLEPDPAVRLGPRNASKVVRSRRLQRLLLAPPWPLSATMPAFRRVPAMHRLRGAALRLNSREQPRPPMDPALRRRLTDEQRPSVERLEALIGRDLSPWK